MVFKYIKDQKAYLIPIIVFSVFSSIFSGLSIGLIIPLLEGNDRNIFSDTSFKFLDSFLQYQYGDNFREKIIQISLIIIFLSLLEFLFSVIVIHLSTKVEYKILLGFIEKIFNKINELEYKKFFSFNDGEVFTIITTDIYNVGSVITRTLISIQYFILMFIYFLVMFSVSPYLTFVALVFFVFISIVASGIIGKKAKKINAVIASMFLNINSDLAYFIENYKKVLSLGIQNKFSDNLKKSYFDFLNQKREHTKMLSYALPLNNFVNTLSIAFLLIVGSFLFESQSSTWTIMLIPFLVLLFKILPLVSTLNNLRVQMESTKPYFDRLNNFFEIKTNAMNDNLLEKFSFNNTIEFKNISFSLNKKRILSDINFKIFKNKVNVIIGPSGIGKTTLLDILLKIYKPDNGNVLIDGKNINEISTNSIRDSISYLPQDLLIVNTGVTENINLYNNNNTDEEIRNYVNKFNFYNDEAFTEEKSNIGLGGINLSGGQKQKINILRTILKDSTFLIFDEPTNNLDKESIELFLQTIKMEKENKTILIITHEEKLLDIADVVHKFSDGSIKISHSEE